MVDDGTMNFIGIPVVFLGGPDVLLKVSLKLLMNGTIFGGDWFLKDDCILKCGNHSLETFRW